jgi:hypothetical protein
MILTESNFLIYAAANYTNHSCVSDDEFIDDMRRLKYLKKLFGQYKKGGVLNERLIMNHLVTLYNVFAPRACTRMLFFKLDEQYWGCLVPFLIGLGYLPERLDGIRTATFVVHTSSIIMDHKVADKVKRIFRGEG